MILSVSRRTDVPNYYSEWFLNRVKEGFVYTRNPMNIHQVSRIDLSPEVVDCIVFWTKNPSGMLNRLDALENYTYYFQFTLTGYGKDIEANLPDKKKVMIPVFRELSEKIGKERVIWRYDPILVSEKYSVDYHLKAFEQIADSLAGYTEKVIISFVDLYTKTQRNTKNIGIQDLSEEKMLWLAGKLSEIASAHGLVIESCAEKIDLSSVNIQHGSCIDRRMIEKLTGCRLCVDKDKTQRMECGCVSSIDIGAYNTCLNGCRYCYANFNETVVKENVRRYDPASPILCDTLGEDDKITERKVKSFKDWQMSLFDLQ